ncbi:MAG: diguanylate cyclase/phosphodiesterase with sensor(s) [Acidimicrobiia bacterium]|nr:diguanylate cyclase/phosphodiesterase with sensor(s) [Acidimicrobiia bacterium]
MSDLLGWTPEVMVGRRSLDFLHIEVQERAINAWLDVLARPGGTGRCRVRHQHRDGSWVWLEVSNRNRLDDPDGGFVDCDMADISQEMAAHEELRASEQLLRRLTEALPVGVMQLDANKHPVYLNEQAYRILGANPDAPHEVLASCAADRALINAKFKQVFQGFDVDFEMYIDRADGSGRRRCTFAFRPLTGPTGEVTGAVASITDITDAARMRNELEARATFDALTGCMNRSTVGAALTDALMRSAHTTAAVYVDLDHFKMVNDKFGHAVGDTVLIAVAARLRDSVRGGDTVGRLGGDEFLVICPDITSDRDALALGERVAAALAEPLAVDGISLGTLASVGIARAQSSHTSAEALIAEADAAMYESKRLGSGRPVLGQGATRQIRASDGVGTSLRRAIDAHELEVHFQPMVHSGSGELMGSEALLRWRRDGELVPAGKFIDAAETTGLICEIGAWVINEVCHQAVASKRSDLRWFLNLSPRELAAPRTIEAFHQALESSGVPASSLVVEITERAALMEGGAASDTIATLIDMGIAIALDDFGTGWSSLASLLSVPAQWLKIDKQFTAAATTNQGEALIAGIVDLAKRVGCCTIAEGIETELEHRVITELGVDYAQGYLFGHPAPLPVALAAR